MKTNVSLKDDDAKLLEQLTQSVSKRLKQKVSQAFVVRMALRELEQVEAKQ